MPKEARARRGRPRLIDRDRIVEAAKRLDPANLTMQALANEIGVDRKTLHYHVDNRASLLKLVAADAFRAAVTSNHFTPEKDWRKAVHSFAHITRDAVCAAGAWAAYVDFAAEEDLEALRPAEAAAAALVDAGLPETEAGRIVATVAVLAFASARDRSASDDDTGRHPQEPIIEQALEDTPGDRFGFIHRLVVARSASLGSDEQFDFEVNLVTQGIERMLEMHRGRDTPKSGSTE
ncbi:TetR/AcrR family transcriptional regulator C-terminal domain-containing protein [Streptomyces ardesiacus]|uniref:TetR/AcrR family transcriptional regulator C-terminal domain-containing protein n=1 Tax=Streptomyces ardesiacus TaxID=285564 RepID=UPI003F4A33FE